MQCVNCGFENIPGMKACVRCQSSLALDAVDVAPPRASHHRTGNTLRQWWNIVRLRAIRLPDVLPRWKRTTVDEYAVKWEAVFASIIPGVGHIRYSNKIVGWVLLTAWICFLIGALLTSGLESSPWLLALAVAIHTIAVTSFLGPLLTDSNLFVRMVFGLLVFAAIQLGMYYPADLLAERFYSTFPVRNLGDNRVIKDDDVLLCEGPWLAGELHRGDLVVYEIPRTYGHGVAIQEGYGIDRIIGVPGDRVQIVKGTFTVNDQPVAPELLPLGALTGWDGLSLDAGDGCVIIPTLLPLQVHGNVAFQQIIAELSTVPRSRILGRVAYRIRPWSRFGPIP